MSQPHGAGVEEGPFEPRSLQHAHSQRADAFPANFVAGEPALLDNGDIPSAVRKHQGGHAAGWAGANDGGVEQVTLPPGRSVASRGARG